LRLWVPAQGVPEGQLVPIDPSRTASGETQPTALPTAGRNQRVRTPEETRTVRATSSEAVQLTAHVCGEKVFRRAGCGKSTSPVRRGESGSRLEASPSLLLY